MSPLTQRKIAIVSAIACAIKVATSFIVQPTIRVYKYRYSTWGVPHSNNLILPLNKPPTFQIFQGSEDGTFPNNAASAESNDMKSAIEEELEKLQQTMALIEALEERNKAQLESFVDEEDQWDSLEEFEKDLLNSKDEVLNRMEKITEELLQLWMGAKSMEG